MEPLSREEIFKISTNISLPSEEGQEKEILGVLKKNNTLKFGLNDTDVPLGSKRQIVEIPEIIKKRKEIQRSDMRIPEDDELKRELEKLNEDFATWRKEEDERLLTVTKDKDMTFINKVAGSASVDPRKLAEYKMTPLEEREERFLEMQVQTAAKEIGGSFESLKVQLDETKDSISRITEQIFLLSSKYDIANLYILSGAQDMQKYFGFVNDQILYLYLKEFWRENIEDFFDSSLPVFQVPGFKFPGYRIKAADNNNEGIIIENNYELSIPSTIIRRYATNSDLLLKIKLLLKMHIKDNPNEVEKGSTLDILSKLYDRVFREFESDKKEIKVYKIVGFIILLMPYFFGENPNKDEDISEKTKAILKKENIKKKKDIPLDGNELQKIEETLSAGSGFKLDEAGSMFFANWLLFTGKPSNISQQTYNEIDVEKNYPQYFNGLTNLYVRLDKIETKGVQKILDWPQNLNVDEIERKWIDEIQDKSYKFYNSLLDNFVRDDPTIPYTSFAENITEAIDSILRDKSKAINFPMIKYPEKTIIEFQNLQDIFGGEEEYGFFVQSLVSIIPYYAAYIFGYILDLQKEKRTFEELQNNILTSIGNKRKQAFERLKQAYKHGREWLNKTENLGIVELSSRAIQAINLAEMEVSRLLKKKYNIELTNRLKLQLQRKENYSTYFADIVAQYINKREIQGGSRYSTAHLNRQISVALVNSLLALGELINSDHKSRGYNLMRDCRV